MSSTYNAGVMSIATEHARAALSDRVARLCVQSAAAELAWQPAGPKALMTAQAQISPSDARQGTGVSNASLTFGTTALLVSKRNRSFEDQMGPRVSWGTG